MFKGILWYTNFLGVSLFIKNHFLHISTVGIEKALRFLMCLMENDTKNASKGSVKRREFGVSALLYACKR